MRILYNVRTFYGFIIKSKGFTHLDVGVKTFHEFYSDRKTKKFVIETIKTFWYALYMFSIMHHFTITFT